MKKSFLHIETPLFDSIPMEERVSRPVYLKMEAFQPTGAFKIRGLGRLCQEYVAAGTKHLVSSSGGNAGYAVAYIGRELGVKVTVFVPSNTHETYIHKIRQMGADVRIEGDVWDETNTKALRFCEQIKGSFVPPFDHPSIWAGHATIIDECAKQGPKPGCVVVAVGGGGLLSGVLAGMHQVGWEDVPVIAVETEGAASFAASIKAGKLVSLPKITSIATTLGAKQVTPHLLTWLDKHDIQSVIVSDSAAVRACQLFSDDHRILVEPACGAALSVVYDKHPAIMQASSVLVIVCGGIGTSCSLLESFRLATS